MYNHYIPQFYTKRWTGSDGRLIRYWRPYQGLVADLKPTSTVGGQEDLYKMPHLHDGTEFDLETKFFKEIDQNASNVMYKIENFGINSLSALERRRWTSFIISLKQRTPERLIELGDQAEGLIKKRLERYRENYSNRRRPSDPPDFDAFISSQVNAEKISQARVKSLESAINIPNSTNFISQMFWKIVTTDATMPEFLTSDRPVIVDEALATRGGFLALPISPRSVFFASKDVSTLADKSNVQYISAYFNKIIVSAAIKEVFGTKNIQTELVDANLRAATIDDLVPKKRAERAVRRKYKMPTPTE